MEKKSYNIMKILIFSIYIIYYSLFGSNSFINCISKLVNWKNSNFMKAKINSFVFGPKQQKKPYFSFRLIRNYKKGISVHHV